MENQDTQNKKTNWPKIFLIAALAISAYGGLIWALRDTAVELKDTNAKLLKEQGLTSTCSYKRDSLMKENKRLSVYETLTRAMVHRDEAVSMLKYKVGDFIYLKRDSARVVIEDVVIGGAKYDYYVRYKVLHKDNHSEEIKPELAY
jgi:hypothetical protein